MPISEICPNRKLCMPLLSRSFVRRKNVRRKTCLRKKVASSILVLIVYINPRYPTGPEWRRVISDNSTTEELLVLHHSGDIKQLIYYHVHYYLKLNIDKKYRGDYFLVTFDHFLSAKQYLVGMAKSLPSRN
jgi:hypothetical protein